MKNFIIGVTKAAGEHLLKYYGKSLSSKAKSGPTDFVTKADVETNTLIVAAIQKRFPTHGIVSEEMAQQNTGAEYVWYIDPLDGTRSFMTRTPHFAVLIALAHHGVVRYATTYNPLLNELFYAEKGKGAFRNGKRIHVSHTTEWERSWGFVSTRLSKKNVDIMSLFARYAKQHPFNVSAHGSTGESAMYIADGRRDWWVSHNASVWDYAAASLIIPEAGGVVTTHSGKPWGLTDTEIVGANPFLHKKVLSILKGK